MEEVNMADFYSLCDCCKNRLQAKNDSDYRCKAFPKGIPDEIVENKFKHTKPYPGDNNILFECSVDKNIVRKHPLLEAK